MYVKKGMLIWLITVLAICLSACRLSERKAEEKLKKLVEETKNDNFPVISFEESEKLFEKEMKTPIEMKLGTYRVTEWDVREKGMRQPKGVLCRGEEILLVDAEMHQIFRLDYEGNVLGTIGQMGSGPAEFQKPADITEQNGKIYVLDAGNRRIQILNEKLEYEGELPVTSEMTSEPAEDGSIAVDAEENVYLSRNLVLDADLLVYPKKSESPEVVEHHFYGCLSEKEGEVYAVNRGYFYFIPEKEETGVRGGKNGLWRLEGTQAEKVFDLPPFLYVSDFRIRDELILYSSFYMSLMDFNTADGSYLQTRLEKNDGKTYMHYLDEKDGCVYLTGARKGKICVVMPEE